VGTSHSQTENQTPSFGHSHTDSQTPSVKQTLCNKRRQYLYTAAFGLIVHTPTQALANQRPQLQLCLQLARIQPSGNGIKMQASNRLVSVPSVRSVPAVSSVPSPSLAAPLSARVHHGSSPHLRGQQLYTP
jgi:hypothetical protein